MTSLRASLPPAGSTLWGKERRSSSAESGHGPQSLITHVVIREVWKKETPSPHALYKIDVMTKSNHWFVLKRYREFNNLHKKLVASYGIPKDMIPPKKLTSKMSLKHLEKRRDALEHYLQRLVNSSTYVSSSQEILDFLDVGKHDVMAVTKTLATELLDKGEKILAEHGSYTFSVTELYCITRQLQLPEPMQASEDNTPLDLGHLYSFVYQLEDLRIGNSTETSKNCQELASHLEFDISLFRALRSLKIDGCPVNLIKGLSTLQGQLKYLVVHQSLKNMRELLVDRVVEKRRASTSASTSAVASWRSNATAKLTQDRVIIQPWVQLTNLTLSHNTITMFDDSMKLLPELQSLNLSYNDFVNLDLLQMDCPSLTHLDLSHNAIHFISGSPRTLDNLKSLVLDHNNLQTLTGLESLVGLIELNVASNQIGSLKEVARLSGMSQLRYLSVDGNPLTRVKSYRSQIFSLFKGRRIVLDNASRTDEERCNVSVWPTRSRTLSSPKSSDTKSFEQVVRLVRAHSYDALGNSQHDDDDDDDDDNDDDDNDSGIEGYTQSVTSLQAAEGVAEAADEGKQEDLEFYWSYYDFLDLSGNMTSLFVSGKKNYDTQARQDTHRNDAASSSALMDEKREKLGKQPHSDGYTLYGTTDELEERIREEMCQEKTESTSSTEVASEVSANGNSSQSDSANVGTDDLRTLYVQEDEELPGIATSLPGIDGSSGTSTNDCAGDLRTEVSNGQEDKEIPGSVPCFPGIDSTSGISTNGTKDKEIPGSPARLHDDNPSDTTDCSTDNRK